MLAGEIIYLAWNKGYVRYKIHKVFDDSILALTYKSEVFNWIPFEDVITTDDFAKIYNNEKIYE